MDKLYKLQTTVTFAAADIVVRAKTKEAAMAYATSTEAWKSDGAFTDYTSDAPKDDNSKPIFSITPTNAIEITTPHDIPVEHAGDVLPWGENGPEELCLAEMFYGIQDPYDAGVLAMEEDDENFSQEAVAEAWSKYHDDKEKAIEKFNSVRPTS